MYNFFLGGMMKVVLFLFFVLNFSLSAGVNSRKLNDLLEKEKRFIEQPSEDFFEKIEEIAIVFNDQYEEGLLSEEQLENSFFILDQYVEKHNENLITLASNKTSSKTTRSCSGCRIKNTATAKNVMTVGKGVVKGISQDYVGLVSEIHTLVNDVSDGLNKCTSLCK